MIYTDYITVLLSNMKFDRHVDHDEMHNMSLLWTQKSPSVLFVIQNSCLSRVEPPKTLQEQSLGKYRKSVILFWNCHVHIIPTIFRNPSNMDYYKRFIFWGCYIIVYHGRTHKKLRRSFVLNDAERLIFCFLTFSTHYERFVQRGTWPEEFVQLLRSLKCNLWNN